MNKLRLVNLIGPQTWKPVPAFPAYEIWRAEKIRRRFVVRGVPPKILKPCYVRGRYPVVALRRDGRTYKRLVANLRAATF